MTGTSALLKYAPIGDAAKPQVPTSLRKTVCSKKTMKQKRKAIERALRNHPGFLHWSILALYHQQRPEEKMLMELIGPDGRGFKSCDQELFELADDVYKRGRITKSEADFCLWINKKRRSRVGKYGNQLIAIITKQFCPCLLRPAQTRYLVKPLVSQPEAA